MDESHDADMEINTQQNGKWWSGQLFGGRRGEKNYIWLKKRTIYKLNKIDHKMKNQKFPENYRI